MIKSICKLICLVISYAGAPLAQQDGSMVQSTLLSRILVSGHSTLAYHKSLWKSIDRGKCHDVK